MLSEMLDSVESKISLPRSSGCTVQNKSGEVHLAQTFPGGGLHPLGPGDVSQRTHLADQAAGEKIVVTM